jgi:hypothetical protein
VVSCDWLVTVRPDRGCETSALMRSGRSRSGYTCSISDLICIAGSRSDGQKIKGGEMLTAARVPITGGDSDGSGDLGKVATVVFLTKEGDDGVPLDAPETMARRRRRGFPGTEVRHGWRLMAGRGCYGRDGA